MKLSKDLYSSALKSLKSHFFLNIVVAFIVGIVLNVGYNYASDWRTQEKQAKQEASYILSDNRKSNAEILREFVKEQTIVDIDPPKAETEAEKYTMGYFAVIVNEVTDTGSLGFGVLNGINKIVFHGRIGESVVIFAMTVISGLFWVFIKNLIIVGRCRYFMERRCYPYTKADRLLFIYRTGHILRTARTMFFRSLYQTLWDLTIVGGVIKHYEYMMIPYILAENPNISTHDAFALSKQMMRGEKKRAFLIDLTLLPAALLDGATFHLTSVFFLNPYRECLLSEYYSSLREDKREKLKKPELLYDIYLVNAADSACYPDTHCPTPYLEHRRWLTTDYSKDYGGDRPVLFFFFFSFIGWAWEVFFYLINEGSFINRGTMTGPWLPIYGVGGWIIIYLLKPLRKKPAVMFAGTFAVCGIVEYFTSWLLEKMMGQRWWDYTGYFMNLNGRICLEGLLVFGLAGVSMTYFIAPVVDNLFERIPPKVRKTLCTVLTVLFFIDLGWSVKHPNTGDGITEGFH